LIAVRLLEIGFPILTCEGSLGMKRGGELLRVTSSRGGFLPRGVVLGFWEKLWGTPLTPVQNFLPQIKSGV